MRPDRARRPEDKPPASKPQKLQQQLQDWTKGPGTPPGLQHMPDYARERSGIESKEPYTRERSGSRSEPSYGKPSDTPGYGERPGFADKPDFTGRPDFARRPDFTGRPDFAQRPDFTGRPDFASSPFGDDMPGRANLNDIRQRLMELMKMLQRWEG